MFHDVHLTGKCPVCGCAIRSEFRTCARCDVAYHADCWSYSGGCAIYGCRPAAGARATASWELPQSFEAVGQQLARAGLTFTRDVLALGLGTLLGVAFWNLMDTHGGLFFVLWFLLGMAYLLYWPCFRTRGWAVTSLHAFFLGPLVHVVVPLEVPGLFALLTGVTMTAVGLAVLLHVWSPLITRGAVIAGLLSAMFFYRSDGRPVCWWVDRSGPDQPTITAPWPERPVVLSTRTAIHAWRVGGQLERLQDIGLSGYGTLADARWAGDLGRRIAGIAGRRSHDHSTFSRAELTQLLRDPEIGPALGLSPRDMADERLVVIPWWGEAAPEVADVVRAGSRLRVIVELPEAGPPFAAHVAGAMNDARGRHYHRCVVAVPGEPEDVEVEYRAPATWLLGHPLALRLAGYDAETVPPFVTAEPVELDAEWMLRRLAPVLDIYDPAR